MPDAPLAAPPRPIALRPDAPYHLVAPFHPRVEELRGAFEKHFADPQRAGAAQQVWNYWYVPDSYTYLKTAPQNVFGDELARVFFDHLVAFARNTLGMDVVMWPFLSLYVEGCGQTLHNDSRNGAFGYVYSLTRWDTRKFRGGETLLFREQDYWASGRFREAGASTSFYEVIPSLYDQLLVFDDRLIHGVTEVRGIADPNEGRVVLHGHIQIKGPFADGPLAEGLAALLLGPLGDVHRTAQQAIASQPGKLHGFVTTAVEVAGDGRVDGVRTLAHRVLGREGPVVSVPEVEAMQQALMAVRLPAYGEPSRIVLPLLFD